MPWTKRCSLDLKRESLPHPPSRLLRPYAFFFAALTFAQRALCAAAIFLRAEADNVRRPVELRLSKAASAAVNRLTSFCALSSSFFR